MSNEYAVFEVLLMLLGNSICDLKEKKIHLGFTAAFLLIGFIVFRQEERTTEDLLTALIPGIFVIGAAVVSRGEIGIGDGIVLLVTALFIDSSMMLEISAVSSIVSFVQAAAVYAMFHDGKRTLPFIPCLFAGSILVIGASLILY